MQKYPEILHLSKSLENTAKESEIYPTTHELQATRIDASYKQPILPNQCKPAKYQPCLQEMGADTEGVPTGKCSGFQKGDPGYSMKAERKRAKAETRKKFW